ncbi:MAG: hypothetical protein QM784_27475 [Polyangiaceae bacterium]
MHTGAEHSLATGLPSEVLAFASLLGAILLGLVVLWSRRRIGHLLALRDQLLETQTRLQVTELIARNLDEPVALLDERNVIVFENAAFGLTFPSTGSTLMLTERLALDDQQLDALIRGLAELRSRGFAQLTCSRTSSASGETEDFVIFGKRLDRDDCPPLVFLQFRDRTEEWQLARSLLRARRFESDRQAGGVVRS